MFTEINRVAKVPEPESSDGIRVGGGVSSAASCRHYLQFERGGRGKICCDLVWHNYVCVVVADVHQG